MADLGLSFAEVKQLTAALQAEIVPMQVAALGECPRACLACGRRLASKGHSRARFRSLFGDVPVRVRRLVAYPCQDGVSVAKSVAVLDFGRGAAVAPEFPYVTARYAALAPFGRVAALPFSPLTRRYTVVWPPDAWPREGGASEANLRSFVILQSSVLELDLLKVSNSQYVT